MAESFHFWSHTLARVDFWDEKFVFFWQAPGACETITKPKISWRFTLKLVSSWSCPHCQHLCASLRKRTNEWYKRWLQNFIPTTPLTLYQFWNEVELTIVRRALSAENGPHFLVGIKVRAFGGLLQNTNRHGTFATKPNSCANWSVSWSPVLLKGPIVSIILSYKKHQETLQTSYSLERFVILVKLKFLFCRTLKDQPIVSLTPLRSDELKNTIISVQTVPITCFSIWYIQIVLQSPKQICTIECNSLF